MELVDIILFPEQAFDENFQKQAISEKTNIPVSELKNIQLIKRSIDARGRKPKYQLRFSLNAPKKTHFSFDFPSVKDKKQIAIIGMGPAGMFAALELIKQGIKPVIFERGKDVRQRRRDLAQLTKEHIVNPESNYCFGEGGAGTYSDGKLYTRSTKRGDVQQILEWLVAHGSPEDILIDAHPHIGTNHLPNVVTKIRESIINHGGEIHFEKKLTDITIFGNKIKSITINENETLNFDEVILATGHSARDIFQLLQNKKITIEYKPFALGVRVEHSQKYVDSVQYNCEDRGEYLPAASYKLVNQTTDRGVYSFCMCPGGIIAPCATSPKEIVTNGWSPSKRNNPYANSGIVSEIKETDLKDFSKHHELRGLFFQSFVEQKAYESAGNTGEIKKAQLAPAQKLIDFVKNKTSITLPDCSYIPGVTSVNLHEVLPKPISLALKESFKEFGKKMKGFLSEDAIIVGVESRTSSPVKIPRDRETLEHTEVNGLYPCGEGAGYAGGIVSAAIDGVKVAQAIYRKIHT